MQPRFQIGLHKRDLCLLKKERSNRFEVLGKSMQKRHLVITWYNLLEV